MRRALLIGLVALVGCGEPEPDAPAHPSSTGRGAPAEATSAEASTGKTPSDGATPGAAAAPAEATWDGTTLQSGAGHWRVVFATRPAAIPLGEPFDVVARIEPAAGETALPVGVELAVDAGMPQHGHGMNRVPLHERGANGEWLVRGLLFHMPGAWTLTFDVTLDGLTERAATVVTLE